MNDCDVFEVVMRGYDPGGLACRRNACSHVIDQYKMGRQIFPFFDDRKPIPRYVLFGHGTA